MPKLCGNYPLKCCPLCKQTANANDNRKGKIKAKQLADILIDASEAKCEICKTGTS